ncbi:MAG TPA: hypothetical protein VM865_09605 [Acidobacteriaceae bacterium]|jgi:hypothetical protein|nr:hypothetical protein [Acidobacteriaceae bacterium]
MAVVGWKSGLLLVAMSAGPMGRGVAGAQSSASAGGCTLNRQVYTCNWGAFRKRLDAAHSIAVQTARLDRPVAAQVRELVQSLGKQVAGDDDTADLTFLLIPWESTGISVGTADEPLATLRVYAPDPQSGRRELLWAETYYGPSDRPWQMTARALIDQFRDRVKKG